MVRLIPQRISSHLHHRHNGSTVSEDSRDPSPGRKESTISTLSTVSTASTVGDQKPLILKTCVVKARNLAAKDKSGTSDPYLVVTLGTSRQSTPSISKTLNPEWKTTFDMPLSGVPLIECVCWDKDRFGKDYMGEFDIAVEDIFANGKMQQEPKWYKLKSTRKGGKKKKEVSGEVQMQFSIVDPQNPGATPEEIYLKLRSVIAADYEDDAADDMLSHVSSQISTAEGTNGEEDEAEKDDDTSDETDGPSKSGPGNKEKKKRKARLRRKSMAAKAYEFIGKDSDVSGIIFMEIQRITDLPPERNMTRTSFDMDPFVVTSLGRKVLRTKVIRHNLNPVFNEKMVFQVGRHETAFSFNFSVIDRDKLSGNDFIASSNFPIQKMVAAAPQADPETGLYDLPDIPDFNHSPPPLKENKSRFRLPLSRSSSSTSISKLARPTLKSTNSQSSLHGAAQSDLHTSPTAPTSNPFDGGPSRQSANDENNQQQPDDPAMISYTIPLELKHRERWEDKHSPELFIKAKYLPYHALRQQFWRAMLKQYDADESGRTSKIELTTMLDTLGSTLHESTIDGFFERFADENASSAETLDLTFSQAVICLEDQLEKTNTKKYLSNKLSAHINHLDQDEDDDYSGAMTPKPMEPSAVPTIQTDVHGPSGEQGKHLDTDDLAEEGVEEHVIEIRECPLCHQPGLDKRSDADIVTHMATCASTDWRQVNNLVMGGFVTASQARRKWYSKVITKIGYGGYKLGANSANILVQDRITGQINEERMSVYVRLGIRLLYKALGNREMEKKRIRKMLKSLSIKQGKKYDDPASASQIEGFVAFHQLDMSEVLMPMENFRNFNEFFYRALKPDARPCSARDDPKIIVSPADCRSVVFDTMDDATRIWVKGRDYSVERLFGEAYPLEAKRYKGGALGIFRLAPQDYHRFHVPVDGVIGSPKVIDGEYYTVNPMAIRSALDVYGDNIRVLIPIDSVAHGRVMFVCIGAMMVGSTVITRKPGERVKRAEELGYFKFGGSTVLLLFEPGKMKFDDDLIENSTGALETLIRVGMSIGHHPDSGAYTSDMRKENVTQADRQAAQRRIEGSLAPLRS